MVTPSGSRLRCGRVLVVAGDPGTARNLASALSGEHHVDVTTSAKDALGRILWGDRFDVIVCDATMQEMSGTEFHERVARKFEAQARRIVFVAGLIPDGAARRRLHATGCVVLQKPVDAASLHRAVGDHLRSTPPPPAATA